MPILPQIVLIPGTLCTGLLFDFQRKVLGDFGVCIDAHHAADDVLEDVARRIIGQAEGTFSMVALSYGGILAFEILRQVPERVERLVLLNTTHKKPTDTTRKNFEKFLKMSRNGDFKRIVTDYLIDAMLHPESKKSATLRQHVLDMAIETGIAGFHNQVKAQLNRPDSTPLLRQINCPVLVITGRQDKVCTVALHEQMATLIPNATLEIVEDCGHLTPIEQPERLNDMLRSWWAKEEKREVE